MTVTDPARAGAVVALRFEADTLWALDQTLLPWRELELPLRGAEAVADAIRRLAIRGAPLIGVAAGYGVALELARDPGPVLARGPGPERARDPGPELAPDPGGGGPAVLERACRLLRAARPTAVNLAWAVERVRRAALDAGPGETAAAALAEARAIHAQERAASAAMAGHGAELLTDARRLLTHCNTGALAAPGGGTALSVVAELAQRGRLQEVLVTESRPLLQGARLTVYELSRLGIAHQLIVDSAAAGLIASGAVDAVIVGCDRVAANGDVANKVGTYALALAALAAGIDFLVVGPTSSIDPGCPSGAEIEIEERDPEEVRRVGAEQLTLPQTRCRNPAFDVTPAGLVTALVTERGVARPVSQDSLAALLPAWRGELPRGRAAIVPARRNTRGIPHCAL